MFKCDAKTNSLTEEKSNNNLSTSTIRKMFLSRTQVRQEDVGSHVSRSRLLSQESGSVGGEERGFRQKMSRYMMFSGSPSICGVAQGDPEMLLFFVLGQVDDISG